MTMKIERKKLSPERVYNAVLVIYRDTGKPVTRALVAKRLCVKKSPHLTKMFDYGVERGWYTADKWQIFNGLPVWVYVPTNNRAKREPE